MRDGAIIVTGASRGIGAGIALELAQRGFTVGCLSRGGRLPEGDDASRNRLIPLACDVTDEVALAGAFHAVADRAGGLIGLVNNAGVHREARAAVLVTADYEAVMRTNATAVLVACRQAHPHLVAANGGIIVNIGSFFDRLGVAGSLAYCASKAAVGAITRCLAAEWGAAGIAVLNVAPGYIQTEINRDYLAGPGGEFVRSRTFTRRAGGVAEVARLVAAIFVEDIPFLTGETIYLDGGQGLRL